MLRDDVLLLLAEAEGYLSGEEMREKLGVSRACFGHIKGGNGIKKVFSG